MTPEPLVRMLLPSPQFSATKQEIQTLTQFLHQFVKATESDDSVDDMLKLAQSGRACLWAVHLADELVGFVGTETYDGKQKGGILSIIWLGGNEIKRWISGIAFFEEYARQLNCSYVRVEGRKGWQRMLPDYEKEATITRLIKEL